MTELLEMRTQLKAHLSASELEVVVIVEGIDPYTSNTFQVRLVPAHSSALPPFSHHHRSPTAVVRPRAITQARHSYSGEDIVFDQSFVACMSVAGDGMAQLNWDNFHKMKDCPFNASQIIGSSHS